MLKISSILKKDWLIIILILLGFALGAYFYPSLPDRVPIHWNVNGEVNGYGSKLFGAFGLLFILIGNVMGRFKHNYFVGIRTPWTLANEEVWRKTHRVAAPIWVLGGIINILLAFTETNFKGIWFVAIVAVISIVPIVYSYIVYQQIIKN